MAKGDVIRIQRYKTHFESGKGWAEYDVASKKDVFVAMIVGVETKTIDKDNPRLNIIKAMKEMGWVPDPKLPKKTKDKMIKLLS